VDQYGQRTERRKQRKSTGSVRRIQERSYMEKMKDEVSEKKEKINELDIYA
jgi:hypothetical protein